MSYYLHTGCFCFGEWEEEQVICQIKYSSLGEEWKTADMNKENIDKVWDYFYNPIYQNARYVEFDGMRITKPFLEKHFPKENEELNQWVYDELLKKKDEWVDKLNVEINKSMKLEEENEKLKKEKDDIERKLRTEIYHLDTRNKQNALDCINFQKEIKELKKENEKFKFLESLWEESSKKDTEIKEEMRKQIYDLQIKIKAMEKIFQEQ